MKKIIIWVLSIVEIILVCLVIVLSLYKKGLLFDAPIPSIKEIYIDKDNYVNIYFEISANGIKDKIFFLNKKDSSNPDINSSDWKLVNGNTAKYLLDDAYYSFFKNEDNVITRIKDTELLGRLSSFELNKNTIYLALKDSYNLKVSYEVVGHVDEEPFWYSDDEKIAKVDQNGKVTALKKGKTKIHVKLSGRDIYTDVIVTNLITIKPKKYDRSKKYLSCGKYSKAENDLLDKILKDRIKDAGYKTRAGVVEAARFITLEFPYKIKYFSENGRLSGNKVDGEGRYYHKGLYLDESRYESITKSHSGPATWGCPIYSIPAHGPTPNGLDCSGFITWILYNGGFDVKDVGAGISGSLDLTDYGKRTVLTESVVKSGKIKVGDLLASGGPGGGHIALLAGEDENYYYVAESLWTPPNVAALLMQYPKNTFHKNFNYVMLMDNYYKEDGNLTNMWY